ncbi:DJ-1/PfpI family protein [Paenibacillus macerans]|nr:DJ-1/PfpI family protein [Paenibacillus macerans]
MAIKVNQVNPDLSTYDMLFVPGGFGSYDEEYTDWLKGASGAEYIVSVCTGSLLLGAAGFLENKKATTHPFSYELLKPYCREVVQARIVSDGKIITCGGVATSVDLGLYIAERLLGPGEAEEIRKQMDYPYHNTDIAVF